MYLYAGVLADVWVIILTLFYTHRSEDLLWSDNDHARSDSLIYLHYVFIYWGVGRCRIISLDLIWSVICLINTLCGTLSIYIWSVINLKLSCDLIRYPRQRKMRWRARNKNTHVTVWMLNFWRVSLSSRNFFVVFSSLMPSLPPPLLAFPHASLPNSPIAVCSSNGAVGGCDRVVVRYISALQALLLTYNNVITVFLTISVIFLGFFLVASAFLRRDLLHGDIFDIWAALSTSGRRFQHLGDSFNIWATLSTSGRRFWLPGDVFDFWAASLFAPCPFFFRGVRRYGQGGSDTAQLLTGRPPPLRCVSWVSLLCHQLRWREVCRSGQGGSDTDQCLTGRPPPLRCVCGFLCALVPASTQRALTQQEVCRYGQGGSDQLDCSPSPSASKVRIVIPGTVLGHARYSRGVPCRPRRVGSVVHSACRLRLSGMYLSFLVGCLLFCQSMT